MRDEKKTLKTYNFDLKASEPCWHIDMLNDWSIDSSQIKVSTDQYHMTILQDQVKSSLRSHEVDSRPRSWAHVRLTCYMYNQGQVVGKPVNAKPGLKVNPSIIFFCLKMFFTAYVVCGFKAVP